MPVEHIGIKHTPHYTTLTSSGRSHFSRVADGLAEFIDNSIQATKSHPTSRNIEIYMSLEFYKNFPSYIMIVDNGKGMTVEEIEKFATYSADIESTGLGNTDSSSCNISRFGVGAKQAGFFLGDRLHVTTRSDTCSEILELVLDENELHERFQRNEEVYESDLLQRSRSDSSPQWDMTTENKGYPRCLQECRRNYEESDSSFTIIAIRLTSTTVKRLQKDGKYRDLGMQLADIYHFHLHPEHLYDAQNSRPEISNCPSTPLCISLFVFVGGQEVIHIKLNEVNDVNSRYFEKASDFFRFSLSVPDPNPVKDSRSRRANNIENSIWHRSKSRNKGSVIVLSLPAWGRDTSPDQYFVGGQSTDEQFDIIDLTEDVTPEPVFRVYWQNRLVPETVVSKLSFFPGAKTIYKCESMDISHNWINRLKGFLFFDSNFVNIANNKLKIQVDPDLDRWINDRQISKDITSSPKNAKDRFKSWLKVCHKKYDQEFVYTDRVRDSKRIKKAMEALKSRRLFFRKTASETEVNDIAVYNSVQYGYGSGAVAVKGGDVLKLSLRKNDKKGKAVTVYARVEGFIVSSPTTHDTRDEGFGRGYLLFSQLPEELYGKSNANELVVSLIHIDFSGVEWISVKDLEDLVKEYQPSKVAVEVYRQTKCERIHKNISFNVGMKVDYIAVSIRNAKNNIITEYPGRPEAANRKYSVRLITKSLNTDHGICRNCSEKSEHRDGSIKFISSGHGKAQYYVFHDICLNKAGKHTMVVEVLDDNEIVHFEEFSAQVSAGVVNKIKISDTHFPAVQLDSYLPGFTVEFFDSQDNATSITGDFSLRLRAENLSISCGDNYDHTFHLKSNETALEFEVNKWLVETTDNEPFISRDQVSKKEVEVTADFSQNDVLVSETFKMCFVPGFPKRIAVTDLEDRVLSVRNGDTLSPLSVVCFDSNGNRTGPMGDSRWIVRLTEGPLHADHDFPVSAVHGVATLSHVRVDVEEEISCSAMEVIQELYLEWVGEDGVEISQSTPPKTQLLLLVSPGHKPKSMEVLYCGRSLPDPWELCAGSIVTDLRLYITDECEETPFEKNRKRRTTATQEYMQSLILPDIELPTDVGPQSFDVECLVDGTTCLQSDFSINVVPGDAVKWSILSDNDDIGVISSCPEDFAKKIKGVCVVDSFGNKVRCGKNASPILSVRWTEEDRDENVDVEISTIDLIQSEDELRFVPKEGSYLSSSRAPCPLWVSVSDIDNIYEPYTKKITLNVGRPEKILLRCESILGKESQPSNELLGIPLTSAAAPSDIEILLVDGQDNIASLRNVKITGVNIDAQFGEEEDEEEECRLFSKKNPKSCRMRAEINVKRLYQSLKSAQLLNITTVRAKVSGKFSVDNVKKDIEAANIEFYLIKQNMVVALEPEVHILSTYNQRRTYVPTEYTEVTCGQKFRICLNMKTEDDKPANIDTTDIDIRVEHRDGRKKLSTSIINVEHMMAGAEIQDGAVLYPGVDITVSGKYCIHFHYTESRPHIKGNHLLQQECDGHVVIVCHPGPGIKLDVSREVSHQVDNLCISNSNEGSVIVKNLKIHLKDEYENDAEFTHEVTVVCHLFRLLDDGSVDHSPDARVPSLLVPQDSVSMASGLVGQRVSDRVFVFPNVQLDESCSASDAGGDGRLQVRFTLVSKHDANPVPGVEPYSFLCNFTTDEGRALRERKFKDDTQPLVCQRANLCDEISRLRDECRVIGDSIQNCLSETRFHEFSQLSQSDIPAFEIFLREKKLDMERACGSLREVKKSSVIDIPDSVRHLVQGQVVDLGFVNGCERTAFIMSWAAQEYMDALVVEDQSPELYSAFRRYSNIKFWPLNRVFRSTFEERTYLNPRSTSHSSIPGNPRDMVNIIALNDCHEGLRDSIFYHVFRGKILVDTDSEAWNYWNSLRTDPTTEMPTIYTLEGSRINANGIVLPGDNAPERLDYVFGEQSPLHLEEFKKISRDLAVIDDLKSDIERKKQMMEDIENIELRLQEVSAKICDLETMHGMSVSQENVRPQKRIYSALEIAPPTLADSKRKRKKRN